MPPLLPPPHPGFFLAGTQSSSGKTTLMALLLAALRASGYPLQPFKVGPDFIDPGYHRFYAEAPSVNLDSWIMGEAAVRATAERLTAQALGVGEGVMGLFDGAHPDSDAGSTLELARWLNWPVVLVVPVAHAGRSVLSSIRGFLQDAGPERIIGVILNQVSSDGHARYLRKAWNLEVPLLGLVPRLAELEWPERHLGLRASTEQPLPPATQLARLAEEHLDLAALKQQLRGPETFEAARFTSPVPSLEKRKRVGVAQDEAFHFYYQANLDWLEQEGVEVVSFSPLADSELPRNLDALVLGGGFPEVFAEQMAENAPMRHSLREAIAGGLPCYAECGGLMLLAERLHTSGKQSFPMVGAVPGNVRMTSHLQHFGYCYARHPELPEARGHEFHHSEWLEEAALANAWEVTRHSTGVTRREGFRTSNLHASYVHLHFAQAPELMRTLLKLKGP